MPILVPAGFVITSEACVIHMSTGEEPPELAPQVAAALERLQARVGRRFGDADDPLLLSVRSGSRESMPGMMDTVLNLGLNDGSVEGLARATGNGRFAWDCYRRFVQMFSNVVHGVSGEHIEDEIAEVKARHGVHLDTELDVDALRELTEVFKRDFERQTGEPFPQDPAVQLDAGDPRRVRLLERRPRRLLPADQPHPRRLGDGGQRAADGVRQQGRALGLRRRVQPRRADRRTRAVR